MSEVTIYLLSFIGIISLNYLLGKFAGIFSILILVVSLVLVSTNVDKLWPLFVFITVALFTMRYFPNSLLLKFLLGIWILGAYFLDWLRF